MNAGELICLILTSAVLGFVVARSTNASDGGRYTELFDGREIQPRQIQFFHWLFGDPKHHRKENVTESNSTTLLPRNRTQSSGALPIDWSLVLKEFVMPLHHKDLDLTNRTTPRQNDPKISPGPIPSNDTEQNRLNGESVRTGKQFYAQFRPPFHIMKRNPYKYRRPGFPHFSKDLLYRPRRPPVYNIYNDDEGNNGFQDNTDEYDDAMSEYYQMLPVPVRHLSLYQKFILGNLKPDFGSRNPIQAFNKGPLSLPQSDANFVQQQEPELKAEPKPKKLHSDDYDTTVSEAFINGDGNGEVAGDTEDEFRSYVPERNLRRRAFQDTKPWGTNCHGPLCTRQGSLQSTNSTSLQPNTSTTISAPASAAVTNSTLTPPIQVSNNSPAANTTLAPPIQVSNNSPAANTTLTPPIQPSNNSPVANTTLTPPIQASNISPAANTTLIPPIQASNNSPTSATAVPDVSNFTVVNPSNSSSVTTNGPPISTSSTVTPTPTPANTNSTTSLGADTTNASEPPPTPLPPVSAAASTPSGNSSSVNVTSSEGDDEKPSLPPISSTLNCQCGVQSVTGERVGSTVIRIMTNPWLVEISDQNSHLCAGTIINNKYVLTSAKCVHNKEKKNLLVTSGLQLVSPTTFKVAKVALHPKFNEVTLEHDIALLRLAEPIEPSAEMRPICLPTRGANHAYRTAHLVTWIPKHNSKQKQKQLHLLQTEVELLNRTTCQERVNEAGDNSILSNTTLCATPPGQKKCGGDVGGPLQVYAGKFSYEQLGIVSWSVGCRSNSFPGVYTDIRHYVRWILFQTQDGDYCKEPSLRSYESQVKTLLRFEDQIM